MNEREEEIYMRGETMAWLSMLRRCLRALRIEDTTETKLAELVAERQAAIETLRQIAENGGGDNDWTNELHLSDIIEKHMNWSRE